MALLKEDGSLDIERINKLPLREYMEEMGTLTQEQVNEYISKLPLNETKTMIKEITVDYPIEEEWSDAEEVINNIGKNLGS